MKLNLIRRKHYLCMHETDPVPLAGSHIATVLFVSPLFFNGEFFWEQKLQYCIVLYCIVSIHLYSASCSAHQSEALPVRETQREESSLERTKRGTWLTS